jgi:hypothetical protein
MPSCQHAATSTTPFKSPLQSEESAGRSATWLGEREETQLPQIAWELQDKIHRLSPGRYSHSRRRVSNRPGQRITDDVQQHVTDVEATGGQSRT